MLQLITTLTFLLASTTSAQITQKNFTGIGNIHVLNSSDWRTASPDLKVGCLDDKGKFISPKSDEDCGVFSRLDDYPYTLSSKHGNCTFNDETQEKNSDSYYGSNDRAWNCLKPFAVGIYDELYTVVSNASLSNVMALIGFEGRLPVYFPLLWGCRLLLRCEADP
jgi:hypothetical protein